MERRECFGSIEEMTGSNGLTTDKDKTGMQSLRGFPGLFAPEQTDGGGGKRAG